MKTEIAIGEVAARSGVAQSALRFYEEKGLISSLRNASGHRRYHRSVLRRIAFIVFAQRIGLSLEEVAQELGRLPKNEVPQERHWQKLSTDWVCRIDARIDELETLRESLTICIGCGCLSLKTCKLSNPEDKVGSSGPGPARWVHPQTKRRRLKTTNDSGRAAQR